MGSKALLHELGKSLSFGRLSLKAKVLWPMLLASSDDQGRGLAEADAVKWGVCPNVNEIVLNEIPELLAEMVEQSMVHVYQDGRTRRLYQIIRWWEFQRLAWAQPSRYSAPEGWVDRIRQRIEGGEYLKRNWDEQGGFVDADQTLTSDVPSTNVAHTSDLPIPKVDINVGEQKNLKELNKMESNLREDNNAADAALLPPKPPRSPPLTEGQSGFLDPFGAKRFKTVAQRNAVLKLEQDHGTAKLLEAATWAAERGMSVGAAIGSVRSALPKWGKPKARASPGNVPEPKGFAAIRAVMEREGMDAAGGLAHE